MANYTTEPGVATREQVVGYSGASVSQEGLQNLTYIQIVAETGTTDAVIIDGLYSLLSNFTYTKSVNASMPKCFLEAAFMAQYCPLLVKRVAPTMTESEKSTITCEDAEGKVIFKIYHKYPNTKDILRVGLQAIGGTDFKISLGSLQFNDSKDTIINLEHPNYSILFEETYNLSTKLDSVNESGLANDVTILNDYRNDIEVEMINPGLTPHKFSSTSKCIVVGESDPKDQGLTLSSELGYITFGQFVVDAGDNKVKGYYDGTIDCSSEWMNAINELADLEVTTPYFIVSSTNPIEKFQNEGMTKGGFQTTCDKLVMKVAQDMWSFPLMNPYITNYDYTEGGIQNLGTVYGSSTSIGKLPVPGFYDTSLLGRKLLLGGSFDYHRTVVSNTVAGNAYAPVMGTSGNGDSQAGKLLAAFYTKPQRLALLNAGLTPIRYSENKKKSYFVMNNSLRTLDDSISEEQNRRLMNKIHWDIDSMLEDFVGKYNISETRDRVEEAIRYYEKSVLKPLSYGIAELNVKCNTDNNTPAIINANRLEVEIEVRFNRATRWVNILYKLLPVASA